VRGDDDALDVLARAQQADAADQVLLRALVDLAAADVGVAAAERQEQLLQRDAAVLHAREVGAHLPGLDRAAHADDVRHARRHLQLPLDGPLLDRAQFAGGVAVAAHAVAHDLADRGRQRRQLRRHARRQVGRQQPFADLLPREVVADLVVERQHQERQPELRVREQPDLVRQTVERHLERDRDLLFDLLRRAPRVQRDDVDLGVGDVGERLDRQRPERDDAAADEQRCHQQEGQRLVQGERDDALDHRAISPWPGTPARAAGSRW